MSICVIIIMWFMIYVNSVKKKINDVIYDNFFITWFEKKKNYIIDVGQLITFTLPGDSNKICFCICFIYLNCYDFFNLNC